MQRCDETTNEIRTKKRHHRCRIDVQTKHPHIDKKRVKVGYFTCWSVDNFSSLLVTHAAHDVTSAEKEYRERAQTRAHGREFYASKTFEALPSAGDANIIEKATAFALSRARQAHEAGTRNVHRQFFLNAIHILNAGCEKK
jgi:hypothetical protein